MIAIDRDGVRILGNMVKGQCRHCEHWIRGGGDLGGFCYRFPERVEKHPNSHCGEFWPRGHNVENHHGQKGVESA